MSAWPPPPTTRSNPTNTESPMASAQNPSAHGSDSSEVTYDPESPSNPYYLHANENPALELVSSPMDGSNYHPWARAMTMALSCKNKLVFVDGSIVKPAKDDRKYAV